MPSKAYKIKLSREQDRRAKVTDEQVKEIRDLYAKGATQKGIAEIYHLSQSAVSYIVSEKAHENLRKYRQINPPKRRTKEEAATYMRDLRNYKMGIYRDQKDKGEKFVKECESKGFVIYKFH